MAVHYITVVHNAASDQRPTAAYTATGGTITGANGGVELVFDPQYFASKLDLITKTRNILDKLIETQVATLG